MKKHNPDNDWTCPYCGAVAWEGENKLRHLSSHEPCIRRIVRDNFLMMHELTFLKLKAIGFDGSEGLQAPEFSSPLIGEEDNASY